MAMLAAALVVLLVHLNGEAIALNFDPSSYLEVYPDPRDDGLVQGRTPLYFALIQSLGGSNSQFDGSGSVAGVKVALDRINNDSSILPGYTLHYTFTDSMCNRTVSLNALFTEILREPTKLAIIGSGCSPATEPTAEISYFYNLTQISCVSSSTALRNRLRFPLYFQLLSTEETLAYAYYGVIREYGWKQLALLVQNENLFTVTIDTLMDLLDADSVNYTVAMFDSTPGTSQLGDTPFDTKQRIFLLAMYSIHARPLLCKAYEQGIRLPRYLLLTPGWYNRLWWREQDADLNCTVAERESVLQSSLAFLQFEFLNASSPEDKNAVSSTGITGGEFLSEEQKFLGLPPLNLTLLEYSQYCYDATWTLAYALNATLDSLENATINRELAEAYNVTTFTLQDYAYTRDNAARLLFEHLAATNFTGITGDVNFGPQGIRSLNELTIFQFRNVTNETSRSVYLDWVKIGTVTPTNDTYTFSYVDGEDVESVWQGLVPYDGVPREVWVTVHPAVVTLFMILAAAGIALAIACLIFNFYFRKSKLIMLASTKLNYLIIVGAIILYVDIIFTVVPSTDPIVVSFFCNLTSWLSAIGYSLCYGTILVKMTRVYYIFNNPTANKKGLQDWMLVLAVFFLVGIDVVILLIYTIIEGSRGKLEAEAIQNPENPSVEQGPQGRITDYYVWVCMSLPRDIFLAILYGYKMILQILALVLAFSIRKVKVKGLDDSKYVAAAIYVTSLAQAVVIVATFTVTRYINGFAVLFSISFLTGTTVILLLVFLPLMVGLYKDPKGEDIFSKVTGSEMNNNVHKSMKVAVDESTNDSRNNDSLRKRIVDLEAELKAAKDENMVLLGKKRVQIESRTRKDSVVDALESSHMVSSKDMVNQERSFTGTIWDTPEDRKVCDNEDLSDETATRSNGSAHHGGQNKVADDSTTL